MDDDQQFCLRWKNHQSTLVAVFDTLLENGTLVDCILAAEGKHLSAHKVVLSACSPFFESLFSKHYDKHPVLILKDVKFQELKAMVDYMYRGEVSISQDQLGALLKAAESLQIKGLSDRKPPHQTLTRVSMREKGPQPTATASQPKAQGLTVEQRSSRDDSRKGSQSPGARKRKRARRKLEDLDNHHDVSNSPESHNNNNNPHQITNVASTSNLSSARQNIPLSSLLPASTSSSQKVPSVADVPEPVESKAEILTRHMQHQQDDIIAQAPSIKEKIEARAELMVEPKSEDVDEMNEDTIEDLTLDDDDMSNMESVSDGVGANHGNASEGSSQAKSSNPSCVDQWELRLKHATISSDNSEVDRIFQEGTKALKEQGLSLWIIYLRYYSLMSNNDLIEKIYREGVTQPQPISEVLKPKYIEWLALEKGMNAARKQYSLLSTQPPFCKKLHTTMSKLESTEFKYDLEFWNRVHELACQQFGKNDVDVWINYIMFFMHFNRNKSDNDDTTWRTKVQAVHDEALATLDSHLRPEFNEKYMTLGERLLLL